MVTWRSIAALGLVLCLTAGTCADSSAPTQPITEHALQAIKDWKAVGNPWHQRCSAYQVYLHWVPQDDLPYLCGADAQLYACLDGLDIYAAQEVRDTTRADYVVEHELRHWLSGCEFATVNGAHDDPRVWYSYRGQDIRD